MKTTPEMVETMRQERAAGVLPAEIAKRHGVSESTVKRKTADVHHGRTAGTKTGTPRKATASESAEMWRLWVGGMSQARIGERFDLSQPAVSIRLRNYSQTIDQPTRAEVFARELDLLGELRHRQMAMVTDMELPEKTRLEAADRVLKGMERLSKMMGLDAAQEVTVVDPVRFEIVGIPDEALS